MSTTEHQENRKEEAGSPDRMDVASRRENRPGNVNMPKGRLSDRLNKIEERLNQWRALIWNKCQ